MFSQKLQPTTNGDISLSLTLSMCVCIYTYRVSDKSLRHNDGQLSYLESWSDTPKVRTAEENGRHSGTRSMNWRDADKGMDISSLLPRKECPNNPSNLPNYVHFVNFVTDRVSVLSRDLYRLTNNVERLVML